MTSPTVQVFVSSTWLDLQPEREAVEAAVQRLRETKFVGMEYFGSRDETTRRASLDEVDRSHLYVGVIGGRYGSGITEDEYRRAVARGLPCLIYFKQSSTVAPEHLEQDAGGALRLEALKAELRREHTVTDFANPHDLAAKVTADLHRWLFDEYLTPQLEKAARGEIAVTEARPLLEAVRDLSAFNRDLLARLQQLGLSSASYNQALHQLRAPVGDFVGREREIATLTDALRSGGRAGITGINGMGGIGKTELALLVADRLRVNYPDAQLLIDMRGTSEKPREPEDALAACIRAFTGPETKPPDDLEELVRLYRSILDGKRVLVLLDNAFDSAQVSPLLPPPGCALLVTSRVALTLPNMKRLTLDQLAPAEARDLLTGLSPRTPPEAADQISYLCGYLPLAIRAAGSLLDVTVDLDPADYVAQLRDERNRLELIGQEGVDVSVAASFGLSYERLLPEAARVFRLLAVFPATFDAKAEEVVCEDDGHAHLSNLLRRNLVLYEPATKRYRLHDLVRLFAGARLNEDERYTAQKRHASYYLVVSAEANNLYKQGSEMVKRGLVLFDLEWSNIQVGQSWASEHTNEDDVAASLCSHYPNAGAYLLSLRQSPRERISWLEASLLAAQRIKDRSLQGAHLANLGSAYDDLGEVQRAVELYEQALVITRELGDRRSEGSILGLLGVAYSNLGETQQAFKYYEDFLVITRETGDRRGESQALGNLGNAYMSLADMYRAIEFYEQALAIDRKIGNRHGEGQDLGNLGIAYDKLGETRRAIELYEQRLVIAREIGDRRGESIVLWNMSLALDTLGERDQAIAHAEAALKIKEQIEDPIGDRVRKKLAEWRGQGNVGRTE